jgi:hypothetical protein
LGDVAQGTAALTPDRVVPPGVDPDTGEITGQPEHVCSVCGAAAIDFDDAGKPVCVDHAASQACGQCGNPLGDSRDEIDGLAVCGDCARSARDQAAGIQPRPASVKNFPTFLSHASDALFIPRTRVLAWQTHAFPRGAVWTNLTAAELDRRWHDLQVFDNAAQRGAS